MATQFHASFAGNHFHADLAIAKAIEQAAAAEQMASGSERNPRRRICRFLFELAQGLDLDGGRNTRVPINRQQLAGALGMSVVRIKRGLALLELAGVLACDDDAIRLTDWKRLCAAAQVPVELDAADLDADVPDGPFPWFAVQVTEPERHLITGAGDQAYFG